MIVRFEDVITRVTGNVDRYNTDLEYYVGGDQYDSSALTIERRGNLKKDVDILGFKFHFPFKSGDVLLMARNPHLRKAGQVFFDGLCSDASYILRTKNPEVLLQDYIPILLQRDHFWDFFESHKTGGITFLMNWGMLKTYEFDLPPIEKQREVMEKVWAAYRLKQSYQKLIEATDEMVKSRFFEQFSKPEITRVPLIDLCSLFIDGDWIEAKDQSDSGYRLVQTGNVGVCEYLDKKEHSRFVSEETFKRLNCTEIHSGDILFSRLPDPIGRCCIIPKDFPKAITAVDCTITRLKDNCLPEYLMIYTTTTMYSEQIKKCVTGTTRQRISRGNLAKITIPLPDKMKQVEFVNLVHQADKSKFNGFKSRFIEMFGGIQNGRKWPLKKLSEICHLVNGYAFKSALYSNEGFSVIRIANVQKGYIDNSDRAYYPVPFEKEFKDSILQKGDILISLTGNVGRVGVITDKHLPAALNQRVQGLRLRKGIPMSNDFLFCVLNLDEFESLCIENASGSAQLNLSTIWVRNFQIICPPFDKQREFTQFANQADKSKYLN